MLTILTEKSSACSNFAKALGGMSGTYNGEEYRLVHSHGHLFELADPKDQVPEDKKEMYSKWDIENIPWDIPDFRWVKVKKDGAESTLDNIEESLCDTDEVVIATDDDPSGEGELLAWELLEYLEWDGPVSRMYFEDESPKEIQKAFKNRVKISSMEEDGDFVKALTRERWDYLSMQLTRIATLSVPGGGSRMVIRQGRLKSVMTFLIGEQLAAYENYVKVPFFEARYKDENGNIYKREETDGIRFKSKDEVDLVPYSVSDVVVDSKEHKTKGPGKLLDLASISAILASKGFKSKDVLDTYQKMYQDHILSYPRTEDKYITIEQFNELLPLVDDIAEVVGVSPALLTHREPRKTHIKKGMAHGANRPGTVIPSSLDGLSVYGSCAKEIYRIVALNFLSLFGEDYEYEQQKGHIKDHPEFKGSVNIPVSLGFKKIFDADNSTKEQDEEESGTKPLGKAASPFVYEGCNPRPKRPTQKWLVSKLEKYNVGTGATRTQTISDISNEKDPSALITVKKGVLNLTECGNISYRLLNGCDIASVKVTEDLFNKMNDVGKFTVPSDEVINTVTDIVVHDKDVIFQNVTKNNISRTGLGKCPLCGGEIIDKGKAYGCSNYKSNNCNFTIWKQVAGKTLKDADIKALLENGKTSLLRGFKSKSGKSFDAMLKLDENSPNGALSFEFPERKTFGKCPKCGKDIIEGKKGYGCSGYKEGCDFVIWKEVAGKKLTEKNIKDLLEKRTTDLISGFTSKQGKKFDAILKLNDEFKTEFSFPETEEKVLGRCPCCGENIVERPKAYSCSGYKNGCDFVIWKTIAGRKLTFKEAKELLENGETPTLSGFMSKKGTPFSAKLRFDDDNKVQFEFAERPETGDHTEKNEIGKCPVCGKPVYETPKAYSCSGYNDGCSFAIWKTIAGKKITPELATKILKEGSSGKLRGFVSKKGTKFDASLVIGDDGNINMEFD